MLLRGAQLRNTPWIYGIVVFTGDETKLMRNATAAPIKRTAVEKQVNVHIIFLFGFLLALSVRSTIGASVNTWYFFQSNAFSDRAKMFAEDILTFIILYNNFIPISLIVTVGDSNKQHSSTWTSTCTMAPRPSSKSLARSSLYFRTRLGHCRGTRWSSV
ncbi:hypothetical protein HD554DRAFT_2096763 [Boletus coccyginus]|nr:hypothetical protein HD554DRAFT_2096763 [Boletus coccyginus]